MRQWMGTERFKGALTSETAGRLRQRGVGTIRIIIAMVIVGLIVSGIIYYGRGIWEGTRQSTEGTPDGIPLYPGAELNEPEIMDWDLFWELLLPAGWSARNYKVSAEIETVADWYRANMSGWNLENDIIKTDYGMRKSTILIFTSSDDAVVVRITDTSTISLPLAGGNELLISSGPKAGVPYLIILQW